MLNVVTAQSWTMQSIPPHTRNSTAEHTGFLHRCFHSRPTLSGRFFRGAGSTPMGFEADRVFITVSFQCPELTDPIDHTMAHRRPIIFFSTFSRYCIFTVAMTDAVLGKK